MRGGFHHLYQVSQLSLYGHTSVLRLGRFPVVQAFGTRKECVPVLPLDQCDMHSRPVCVCVCVCMTHAHTHNTILSRKACMGLRVNGHNEGALCLALPRKG